MKRGKRTAAILLVVLVLSGCGPEAGRAVGGGLGADIGNHAPTVPKSKMFGPTTTDATTPANAEH